jgi:hypothetical protein
MLTGHAVRGDLAPQSEMRAPQRTATSFERAAARTWRADTGPERQLLGDEREAVCTSGTRPSTRPTRLPGTPKKTLARTGARRGPAVAAVTPTRWEHSLRWLRKGLRHRRETLKPIRQRAGQLVVIGSGSSYSLECLSLLSPRSALPCRCGPVAQWIERRLTSLKAYRPLRCASR